MRYALAEAVRSSKNVADSEDVSASFGKLMLPMACGKLMAPIHLEQSRGWRASKC